MTQIQVTATQCKVESTDESVLDFLDDFLSFDDGSQKFVQVGGRVRRRNDIGQIRLFNSITKTFPTGLLTVVLKHAKANGVTLNATRPAPIPKTNAVLDWLRPEQKEAVKRGLEMQRGIFWMPTGSGKTEVAIGLTLKIPVKWVFIVHKKDLLYQTAERYTKRTGNPAGIIGDGKFDTHNAFTVATFQTLSRALKLGRRDTVEFLDSVRGVMVDECHTLPANSFWRVTMACSNASYRFGFSGTPLARQDKKSIFAVAALGKIIFRLHPNTLIAAGLLAKPIIHMPKLEQFSDCPTWQGVYGELIVRSTKRNNLISTIAADPSCEKPCLVFVKEVKHGHIIEKRLRRKGISCEFVWGQKQTGVRQAAIKRLVKGDTDVLIASVIFQEGLDIPELRSLIVAAAGKSVIASIQRVGRGMRLDEGKKEFHVWDIMDEGHRTTSKWSKQRKKAYELEGYTVT